MSYLFDAAAERLTATLGSTYSMPVTIAFQVKMTHPSAVTTAAMWGNASGSTLDSGEVRTIATPDYWTPRYRDSGGIAATANVSLSCDGAWTPVVAVFTSNASRRIYLGTIGNTNSNTTALAATAGWKYLSFGRALDTSAQFAGRLAELAVWDVALSVDDITSYLSNYSADGIDATNLLAYWSCAAGNTKTAGVDSVGSLSVSGSTWDPDHPTITSLSPGQPTMGRCIYILP